MTAAYAAWLALASPLAGVAFCIAVGPVRLAADRRLGRIGRDPRRIRRLVRRAVRVAEPLAGRRASSSRPAGTGSRPARFQANVSILVDPLSVVMLLVVTGVGFLIHAYSVGYMHGDREERRFFAYLNLFVFSMLLLVLAGNFVILLAGWGLVGLSSYLLIGFWWERPTAVAAAKKAFIMNAIGDIGIAIALFVIWDHVHSLDYLDGLRAGRTGRRSRSASHTANWIALLLLVGAVAKSAQLPLQTWLPDAMEGPTPVSALIHAATMVTAGVYLVARMWPLYTAAPDVSDLVALIGAADAHDGRADRPRPDRHQAGDRVLDDVADRLHVLRGRDRRVLGRHLPPRHARLLQGAPVPRRRRRDPRARRRAGHPAHGRAARSSCRTRPRSCGSAGSRSRASRRSQASSRRTRSSRTRCTSGAPSAGSSGRSG